MDTGMVFSQCRRMAMTGTADRRYNHSAGVTRRIGNNAMGGRDDGVLENVFPQAGSGHGNTS